MQNVTKQTGGKIPSFPVNHISNPEWEKMAILACAGMSDPAAEIQALREAVESIKSDARDLRKFKKFPESVESLACSILLKLSEITKS